MKVIRKVFNQRCLYAAIPNHDNIAIYAFKRFPKINRSFAEIIDLSKILSDDYKIDFLSIWREIQSLNPMLTKNSDLLDEPNLSNILPR
jgi:hypothetical protein